MRRLAEVYKQLNAPFGQFGADALALSTRAIRSGSSDNDGTYTTLTDQLIAFTARRDALATQIRSVLGAAAADGRSIDVGPARALIADAEILLDEVHTAAEP